MNRQQNLTSTLSLGLLALLGACTSSSVVKPVQAPQNNSVAQGTQTQPASATIFPKEAFRAQQPAATAPRPFNLPGITQFKLAEQIDVYLVERHELPTISMELNFDGGSVSDKSGREGTASVCMSLASEGTQSLDKLAFVEALADTASNVNSYAGTESQGVTMRTLSKNFDATFPLFVDTLLAPGFRKDELGRMVERRLESLKQAKGSPGPVAARLLDSTIYGPKHPFGAFSTENSLGKIKVSDCKSYFKAYIKPQGARLFVVGDMTQKQLTEKFAPLLAKWKGKPKKLAKLPKVKRRKGRVFFVDVPGAAQSSIYLAHMGPNRTAPEFYANQMMSGVLGGGFSSRINMNLREDKGYSYGARGRFGYNRHFGTFVASSSVRSNATRQSLDEIYKEISAIKSGKTPATSEELTRERNGAILGLPARFATASQVLGMYRSLVYFGLPMTYYNDYVKNFSSVKLEQVKAAAASLLHPDDAVILVVGDGNAEQIVRGDDKQDVPRLAADGKTPVTLRDALQELATSEIGGKGSLVTLDADGMVLAK